MRLWLFTLVNMLHLPHDVAGLPPGLPMCLDRAVNIIGAAHTIIAGNNQVASDRPSGPHHQWTMC